MDILIIEDEAKTAKELKNMIETIHPQSEVYAIAYSLKEAEEILSSTKKQPDLIFSDIQLGDGLCFELFERISIKAPIIFVTAYDKYTLNAFRNNGIDYLLKPVQEEELKHSFQKHDTLFKRDANINFSTLKQLINRTSASTYSKTMLVYYREKIIPLPVEEIIMIKTHNSRLLVYHTSKESYIINNSLEETLTKLDPDDFIRANRQYIVNKKYIKSMENLSNRKLLVTMDLYPKEFIQVSREGMNAFLEWMAR